MDYLCKSPFDDLLLSDIRGWCSSTGQALREIISHIKSDLRQFQKLPERLQMNQPTEYIHEIEKMHSLQLWLISPHFIDCSDVLKLGTLMSELATYYGDIYESTSTGTEGQEKLEAIVKSKNQAAVAEVVEMSSFKRLYHLDCFPKAKNIFALSKQYRCREHNETSVSVLVGESWREGPLQSRKWRSPWTARNWIKCAISDSKKFSEKYIAWG